MFFFLSFLSSVSLFIIWPYQRMFNFTFRTSSFLYSLIILYIFYYKQSNQSCFSIYFLCICMNSLCLNHLFKKDCFFQRIFTKWHPLLIILGSPNDSKITLSRKCSSHSHSLMHVTTIPSWFHLFRTLSNFLQSILYYHHSLRHLSSIYDNNSQMHLRQSRSYHSIFCGDIF